MEKNVSKQSTLYNRMLEMAQTGSYVSKQDLHKSSDTEFGVAC